MNTSKPGPARRSVAALALFLLLFAGCEALTNAALRVGSNLLSSAASNYDPLYGESVRDLLTTLRMEIQAKTETAPPAVSEPGPVAVSEPIEELPEPEPATEPEEFPAAEEAPGPEFEAAPPMEASGTLALEVALLRQQDTANGVISVPIQDGDVLHDAGRNGKSDRFKVFFRANQDCYVYVILVDGTGWVQPLFPGPASSRGNPVLGQMENFLPEGELAFALDSYKGVETLYFVASETPRTDLEAALAKFAGKTRRPPPPAQAAAVEEPAFLERGVARKRSGSRGSLSTTRGVVPFETTRFLSNLETGSLVLTRWFRHQ